MPLDKILQAMQAEADGQVSAIEEAAELEVARLKAEAELRASKARASHIPAIQAPLAAERARIINRAKLEALRTVLGTREALISEAIEAAALQLATIHGSDAYRALLERLACEAANTLGTDALRLQVQGQDVKDMLGICERLGLSASVEENLAHAPGQPESLGGVIATAGDGRISLVNSLGERLQRVASLYRTDLAEMLFGSG
jgi:vacuolar-type H+-ATPase subunit E/Vma4